VGDKVPAFALRADLISEMLPSSNSNNEPAASNQCVATSFQNGTLVWCERFYR
jgi:hypothetical protein